MFAVTRQGGRWSAMPNVCITPAPPSPPITVPYMNTASSEMAKPLPEKVSVVGTPPLTMDSKMGTSQGDELGSNGGVMSGTFNGQAEFISGSQTVYFGGHRAVWQGSMTTQSDRNARGTMPGAPSQRKVRFGS